MPSQYTVFVLFVHSSSPHYSFIVIWHCCSLRLPHLARRTAFATLLHKFLAILIITPSSSSTSAQHTAILIINVILVVVVAVVVVAATKTVANGTANAISVQNIYTKAQNFTDIHFVILCSISLPVPLFSPC